jgi:outer membrane lipoprotein-sorting protein
METLANSANRGSISTGFDIDNSLKFEPDNSEMLYTNSLTAGNRRTWTISMWVKRTELSYESAFMYSQGTYGNIRFFTDDKIVIENGGLYLITNRVFRDTSAWYHVVWVNDSTQSTASNRSKLYINGVQETSFSTETYMSQNQEGNVNSTSGIYIGRRSSEVKHFAGYIADVYKIDGQALAPTDFGEFDEDTGIWIPKEYTGGSYSTQGFHLDFSDSSDLGNDSSGENNDFLLQNITSANQAVDTPTNGFAHWNVLMAYDGNEGRSEITEGGTTLTNSNTGNGSSNGWYGGAGTIPVTSGKWYWEYQPFAGTFGYRGVGIMGADYVTDDIDDIRDYGPNLYLRDGATPKIYQHLQSGTNTVYKTMTSWTSNNSDIFAIALNMDDEEITFYRNGTAITENGTSNTTFSISSVIAQSSPIIFHYQSYGNGTGIYFNFGGYTEMSISSAASDSNNFGTFEYAPPSGYYALCTKNLAEYG